MVFLSIQNRQSKIQNQTVGPDAENERDDLSGRPFRLGRFWKFVMQQIRKKRPVGSPAAHRKQHSTLEPF